MKRAGLWLGLPALLLTLAAAQPPEPARPAAALLITSQGPVEPALPPYTQIPDQTVLRLGQDAAVELLHLQTCRRVEARGAGTLTLSRARYDAAGTTLTAEEERPQPCTVQARPLNGPGIRRWAYVIKPRRPLDSQDANRLSPDAQLVVTGHQPDDSLQVRIFRGDRLIKSFETHSPKLSWPGDRLPPPDESTPFVLALSTDKTLLRGEFMLVFDAKASPSTVHFLRLR